jgi:hypothetical protein
MGKDIWIIERPGEEVTFLTDIRHLVGSNLSLKPAILTKDVCLFSYSLQTNAGIAPRLQHSLPFQIFCNSSFCISHPIIRRHLV